MNLTAIVEVKDPSKNYSEIPILCDNCNRTTFHKVLTMVSSRSEYEIEGDYNTAENHALTNNYLTIQCQGCRSLSFCDEYTDTNDLVDDYTIQESFPRVTRTVYPKRIAGRIKPDKMRFYLPREVLRIYSETHTALSNDLFILSGMGIRAIVEAVCKEKSATGKDLKEKIECLVSMGFITLDGGKILHALRFMGNKAVHEVKAHTEDELNVAFEVIEYLLNGVYVLPKRAEQLPQ